MADKKAVGHAYNVDFLNVVFAASSIFLFLSVIWMVWDDFDRDWKNTQRRFAQLEYQVTQAAQKQAAGAVDKNKMAQYEATKKASEAQIKANQAKVDELNKKLAEADKVLFTRDARLQLHEGDLRSGSLRLRDLARRRPQRLEHQEEAGERPRTRRRS